MPTIPGPDAGPVALLIAGISFLTLGVLRGDVVAGYLYRKLEARAEVAEGWAKQLFEALAANTAASIAQAAAYRELTNEVRAMRRELREFKNDRAGPAGG